jgi:hypothetical protein
MRSVAVGIEHAPRLVITNDQASGPAPFFYNLLGQCIEPLLAWTVSNGTLNGDEPRACLEGIKALLNPCAMGQNVNKWLEKEVFAELMLVLERVAWRDESNVLRDLIVGILERFVKEYGRDYLFDSNGKATLKDGDSLTAFIKVVAGVLRLDLPKALSLRLGVLRTFSLECVECINGRTCVVVWNVCRSRSRLVGGFTGIGN